jgi:hypothetical protein
VKELNSTQVWGSVLRFFKLGMGVIVLVMLSGNCSDSGNIQSGDCPKDQPNCKPGGPLIDVINGGDGSKVGDGTGTSDDLPFWDGVNKDGQHGDGANVDGMNADGTGPDGTCIPSCQGKICGDDGCGGMCGRCPVGKGCVGGFCDCDLKCENKVCGDDGCEGVCGECESNEQCFEGGCVCVPACQDKVCGDDGCGASCGSCGPGLMCDDAGQCVCAPECQDKECGPDGCGDMCGKPCGPGLECVEGTCAVPCTPECKDKECGDNGCGDTCGTCQDDELCTDGLCILDCKPTCDGKKCGGDGCGGICGQCPIGWNCKPDGLCTEDCVPICTGKACGPDGCGGTCGLMNGACPDKLFCVKGQCQEECVPDCTGKACGDNGCGGSCGLCKIGGTFCNEEGQCQTLGGSSCLGYCGGNNPNWPCSCDALCKEEGDCCPDICQACEEWDFPFCPLP